MTSVSPRRDELLDHLGERLRPDLRGTIGLDRVVIGSGALEALVGELGRLGCAPPAAITVFEDATPMARAGDDLKDLVARTLRDAGYQVDRSILGPPDGHAHADDATLQEAARASAGAAGVVCVGSGTITDIAKWACRDTTVPLVAVQTAVSVNGFSDDMSVVLRDGVKRTVPSRWVSTLLIDTEVLQDAPLAMNVSGVGELMAMFTAPADWLLAELVGIDPTYDADVVATFRDHGSDLLAAASAVAARGGPALERVAAIMTTSGIALGIAGRTAPISGTEHTISHLLDMAAGAAGEPVGLHGAQVGVAAVIAACVWEHLIEELDPAELTDPSTFPEPAEVEAKVHRAFRAVDPSGAMAAECWADYRTQLQAWHDARPRLRELATGWATAVAKLDQLRGRTAALVRALDDAGAATRFSQLDPSVPADRARWAITNCHLMRNRFTVVDLAFLTGHWTDADVDAVLQRAEAAGAGL